MLRAEAASDRKPSVRLMAGAAGSLGIAGAALVLAARVGADLLSLGPLFVPKALCVFAVTAAAVAASLRAHPFARFGLANVVTTGRAACAALVVALVGERPVAAVASVAATLGLVAVTLDGVDGWLARRAGLASRFGARYDMEVDALLILALSVLAWQHGKAGSWVVLAGLLRYVFLAAGWVLAWMRRPLPPSRRRQAVCVTQTAALLAALCPGVAPSISVGLLACALVVLSWSFWVDTAWLWQQRGILTSG